VYNYAKKALAGNSNDAKLKEFHDEVKAKFTEFEGRAKPQPEARAKGLKRVIVTDPEEGKQTSTKEEPSDEPKIQEEEKQPAYP